MKQEPLNEKKQKKNFNCNFIFQEKNFVFILYLLVNFFKGSGEKYTLNEGGVIQILCQHLGGVSKILCMLIRGEGGSKNPKNMLI